MKSITILIFSFWLSFNSYGQEDSIKLYKEAFAKINDLLRTDGSMGFKKAVFITEHAYLNNNTTFEEFDQQIQALVDVARLHIKTTRLHKYKMDDSLNVIRNLSIFKIMSDTTELKGFFNKDSTVYPFKYNFDDPTGKKEWSNTFVISLINNNKGNCHSLPYLYKILADELETTCWLSFAPYHIYIKNRCKQTGWYNTELSSGEFPVDAWITASGYISMDAIRSGIYMDTLSNKQAIANCMLDLAKGYERKFHQYADSFIIRCCDVVLGLHPNNINAIIYKAEVLKKIYQVYNRSITGIPPNLYSSMEALYLKAMDLGYKEMPETMYNEWIKALSDNKTAYSDKTGLN